MRIWFQSPSLRGSGRFRLRRILETLVVDGFNPLHCGAVVASPRVGDSLTKPKGVSIPFIAGQWSLPGERKIYLLSGGTFQSPSLRGSGRFPIHPKKVEYSRFLFQSPSLRGSGRFPMLAVWRAWQAESFNPLHCGAVVASARLGGPGHPHEEVSIPFIAGQWSLPHIAPRPRRLNGQVSIPFIAGQWSLPRPSRSARG